MIQKVSDVHGTVLFQAQPTHAGQESERAIDPRNAFIMDSMLQQVVRSGTGAMATKKLGRPDLAGKTGTTSDALDGWFAGYSENLVAVSWMGYDDPKSLGSREFGATLALPAWIDYMRVALKGKPIYQRPVPDGITQRDNEWIYSEFAENGAVTSIGMEDQASPSDQSTPTAPSDMVPDTGGKPPARNASPNPPPNPPPPPSSIDQERQKVIDTFR
jgi:penicillin-binding protein 1A